MPSSQTTVVALLYALPLFVAVWLYLRARRKKELCHAQELAAALQAGLTEPAALHPVVDLARCIGSGGCAKACPEQALGVIGGKMHLINPSACIGHGACFTACPVEAIQLVFGTERRGVDIPFVKPNFETNVPGIFIAGELGGMGLVRKAAEQGRQAIDAIKKLDRGNNELDVLIVGAGPAGISAGLRAIEHKLKFRLIEQQDALGGTVYHYPRNKITMTAPMNLPIIGKVNVREISKEALLQIWEKVVKRTGLQIGFQERMQSIGRSGESFIVKSSRRSYRTRAVLLAIGRRGTPRRLDVPGEEQPKVVYGLIDPEQYCGQHVLVVGGGDSALEAAIALSGQPGTSVTLSYRGDAFSRVKEKNRKLLGEAELSGKIRVLLQSAVREIDATTVTILQNEQPIEMANDAVIVCAGGILPTPLLKEIGVIVETKHGKA